MHFVITVHYFASGHSSVEWNLNLGRLQQTLKLANLITMPKIYLGHMCQEVQTDKIGKANSNHGWGVSIPFTYT